MTVSYVWWGQIRNELRDWLMSKQYDRIYEEYNEYKGITDCDLYDIYVDKNGVI